MNDQFAAFAFTAITAAVLLSLALACWICERGLQTPTREDFEGGEDL